jgi:hypothetical protein
MDIFSPLPDELTPASDNLNTVSVTRELCLKPPMNVARVCVLSKEKLNDHSLLVLHPAVKFLNAQRPYTPAQKATRAQKFGPPQTEAQKFVQLISQNQIMNYRSFSLSHY